MRNKTQHIKFNISCTFEWWFHTWDNSVIAPSSICCAWQNECENLTWIIMLRLWVPSNRQTIFFFYPHIFLFYLLLSFYSIIMRHWLAYLTQKINSCWSRFTIYLFASTTSTHLWVYLFMEPLSALSNKSSFMAISHSESVMFDIN